MHTIKKIFIGIFLLVSINAFSKSEPPIYLFIDFNDGSVPINISKSTPEITPTAFSLATIFTSNISSTTLTKNGYFILIKIDNTYVFSYDFTKGDSYSNKGYLGHFLEQDMNLVKLQTKKTYTIFLYQKLKRETPIITANITDKNIATIGKKIAQGKVKLKG